MTTTTQARTTIALPDDLLFEVKERALTERKTMKEVITEGMKWYLRKSHLIDGSSEKDDQNLLSLYGAWGKGPDGQHFLHVTRYGRKEGKRDAYLNRLWKKS